MPILGIIAEYNPFHNGHLYLINEANKLENFSGIICVMSGNFLQRGEPAVCNKWARAEMALRCGADLVIELPFCFAVRSAYYFAKGATQLLHRTGVVTHIAFGSEVGDISTLSSLASIITAEPPEYKNHLKKHLAKGLSFPLARSRAVQELVDTGNKDFQEVLLGPNNILAIEYIRAIMEENMSLIPLTVPRKGSGYHSTHLNKFASATAIRNALAKSGNLQDIADTMPADSLDILSREIEQGRAPVAIDSLEQAILLKLRTSTIDQLEQIFEISEGLEFRFKQAANIYGTLDELKQAIKSKRYSLTRINRTLLYSLFELSKNQINAFDHYGPLYLHILGFSAQGKEILQQIKNKSQVMMLNRGSDVKEACNNTDEKILCDMINLDVKATDVYSLLYPDKNNRKGGKDFTTSPIII